MTIKEARATAGLTQKETAELLGIGKRTLEDWESGRRNPKAGEAYWAERILALGILTEDGRNSLRNGLTTMDDVLGWYKIDCVEKLSKWGAYGETFRRNWERIPEGVVEALPAEQLAQLVDAIQQAYDDGKAERKSV